jgi:ribosomal subunit interface protein
MDLQLTFHEIEPTDAIHAYVEKRADKLRSMSERIIGCRVALETPHRHKRHGRYYRVSIELLVPGKTLAVTRDVSDNDHQDLYAAIDSAFDSAMRVVQDEKGRAHHAKGARGAQTIRYGT